MKNVLFLVILLVFYTLAGLTQNNKTQVQRIITVPGKGMRIELQSRINTSSGTGPETRNHQPGTRNSKPLIPGLNWETTDAASIDNCVKVSSLNHKTAAGWGLNNQRLSLYGHTNVPEWEVPFTLNGWDEIGRAHV